MPDFSISACAWAIRGPGPESVRKLNVAGFNTIDLRPDCWNGIADQAALCAQGVTLACAGITPIQMAPGLSLSTLSTPEAGRALPYLIGALDRAAALGAKWAYVVTPLDRVAEQPTYARSMARLGAEAGARGIKLCVEPHPGRALGDYTEINQLLDAAAEPNLYALVDLGHLLITGEDPAATVRSLGGRIGYVHVDDNDGHSDLHLPLLDGILRPRQLLGFLEALAEAHYDGPLSVELSNRLPSPVSALVASRDLLIQYMAALGKN